MLSIKLELVKGGVPPMYAMKIMACYMTTSSAFPSQTEILVWIVFLYFLSSWASFLLALLVVITNFAVLKSS